jgi:hypothetical protein
MPNSTCGAGRIFLIVTAVRDEQAGRQADRLGRKRLFRTGVLVVEHHTPSRVWRFIPWASIGVSASARQPEPVRGGRHIEMWGGPSGTSWSALSRTSNPNLAW